MGWSRHEYRSIGILNAIGITGWFGCDQAGREALAAAIEGDALKEDDMEMEMQMHAPAESLDKRDRSRLHLTSFLQVSHPRRRNPWARMPHWR
jgi:hypothetical protein